MCSNYKVTRSLGELASLLNARVGADFEFKPHTFPWYEAPVLVLEGGERVITKMHYGMVPSWDKGEEKPKTPMYNARSETAMMKREFSDSYRTRRALAPLGYFYEWVDRDGKKTRIRLEPASGEVLMAAAIWHVWTSASGIAHQAYSILTKEPPDVIRDAGHDRCPVFLKEDAWDAWMNEEEQEPIELMKILSREQEIEWKITDEPMTYVPKDPMAKAGIVKPKKKVAKGKGGASQGSLLGDAE